MSSDLNPEVQRFFARGKLMLTGEYLVLDGAQALAVPTRFGQSLQVTRTDDVDVLVWRSFDHEGKMWFEEAFSRRRIQHPAERSDISVAGRASRLLFHSLDRHPLLWPPGTGLQLEFRLSFDPAHGMGTSSSLAYLLAAWSAKDPFELNQAEFGGSGYDIACAGVEWPLLYRLGGTTGDIPEVQATAFASDWLKHAWLVYLGQKQDSREGMAHYRSLGEKDKPRFISEVDELTQKLVSAADVHSAADTLRRHEALIGYVTHQSPVGRSRFADFPGVVKSLGAWGGDTVLALATEELDVPAYFRSSGYAHCVPALDELANGTPVVVGPKPQDPSLWPVFLHGELATQDAERDWLAGHPWAFAELEHFTRSTEPPFDPIREADSRLPGMLVYLPASDVVLMDLHSQGRNYRRTHAAVFVKQQRVLAQVWLRVTK